MIMQQKARPLLSANVSTLASNNCYSGFCATRIKTNKCLLLSIVHCFLLVCLSIDAEPAGQTSASQAKRDALQQVVYTNHQIDSALALRHDENQSTISETPEITIEVRVGLLVGRRRLPQDKAYFLSAGRQLVHVFDFAIDKINQRQSRGQKQQQQPPSRTDAQLSNGTEAHELLAHQRTLGSAHNGTPDSTEQQFVERNNLTLENGGGRIIVKFKPVIAETYGNEDESVKRTIELVREHQVDVILGPQEICDLEPKIAAVFNVLMISHYCSPKWSFDLAKWSAGNSGSDDHATPNDNNNFMESMSKPTGAYQQSPQQQASTFIQTKPPSWKIVKHVVKFVDELLDSYGAYPHRFVLFYNKYKASATERRIVGRPQSTAEVEIGTRRNASDAQDNGAQQPGRAQHKSATTLNSSPVGGNGGSRVNSDADGWAIDSAFYLSKSAQQYRLIGELLELNLRRLFNERHQRNEREEADGHRRRRRRQQQQREQRHSLSVLHWHTTFHYGYTKNPFRPLIRRHLFEQQRQQQLNGSKVNQCGQRLPIGQHKVSSVGGAAALSEANSGTVYIVVGHYYEHLGLMLALSELGLLDDKHGAGEKKDAEEGAAASAEGGHGDNKEEGAQRNETGNGHSGAIRWQSSVSDGAATTTSDATTTISSAKRGQESRATRRWPAISASIVIGADIEPHDERDDSVRFLRGLLMDGVELGRGEAGARSDAADLLGSVAQSYNRYVGIVPSRPWRTSELIEEIRQFYKAASAKGLLATSLPPFPQSNNDRATLPAMEHSSEGAEERRQLALRLLQFARLPVEAYYLHDSIMLIGNYFAQCLQAAGRNLSECNSGRGALEWFRRRQYASYVNANGVSVLDEEARDEGSYTLIARRRNNAPTMADDTATLFEFDIVPIGSLYRPPDGRAATDSGIELHVDAASIDQVWLPLWCHLARKRRSSGAEQNSSSLALQSCNVFEGQDAEGSNEDYDDDENGAESRAAAAARASSRRLLLFHVLIILAVAASCCLCLQLVCVRNTCWPLHRPASKLQRANGNKRTNEQERDTLNCCPLSRAQSGAAEQLEESAGEQQLRRRRQPSCWFSESDENNFLHIVHELLVGQEVNSGGKATTAAAVGRKHLKLEPTIEQKTTSFGCKKEASAFGANEADQSCKFANDEDVVVAAEDNCCWRRACDKSTRLNCANKSRAQFGSSQTECVSLHCFMFAFPSCRFVHWLTALHQLKEMLFRYQLKAIQLSASGETGKHSDVFRRQFGACKSQLKSCLSMLLCSLLMLVQKATYVCLSGSNLTRNKFRAPKIIPDNQQRQQQQNAAITNGGAGYFSASWRARFFNGQHAGTPMLKLLLNKYKQINECLYELHSLEHPNLRRLVGITLRHQSNCLDGREAQLLLEQCGHRGNLREEVILLNESVHLDPIGWRQFCELFWYRTINDLLNGLNYLHESKLKFHGNLNAQNSFFTSNWSLKLSGFHEGQLRRSLGSYEMRIIGETDCKNSNTFQQFNEQDDPKLNQYLDELLYLAPEVLRVHTKRSLLSASAMQSADLYSFALIIYELLVGEEPWSCAYKVHKNETTSSFELNNLNSIRKSSSGSGSAERGTENFITNSNKLLIIERVKVDATFRPPIERLDKILTSLSQQTAAEQQINTKLSHSKSRFSTTQQCQPMHANICGAHYCCINSHGGKKFATESEDTFASALTTCKSTSCQGCSEFSACSPPLAATLKLCWSQAPKERPHSIKALRNQLGCFLDSLAFAGGGGEHSPISSLLDLYSELVENTANMRGQEMRVERKLQAQLAQTLVPLQVQGNSQARLFQNVSLCLLRIVLNNNQQPLPDDSLAHLTSLNLVLGQLDALVTSYRGHIHLIDSQVDSCVKFVAYAGGPLASGEKAAPRGSLSARRRHETSSASLMASFALQLVDLANELQARCRPAMQVQCSLHIGPIHAGLLEPIRNDLLPTGPLRLSRYILFGESLRVAVSLDKSSQPQRILVSNDFHKELLRLASNRAEQSCATSETITSNFLAQLINNINSSPIDLNENNDDSRRSDCLQQAYVMIRQRNGTSENGSPYWLLNGPRLTAGKKFTLPPITSATTNQAK